MHMKKGCGALAKLAKCNLVTFRIRGAFFVDPNWCNDHKRKGPVSGEIVGVYTPEQLAKMSNDEIEAIIARDLYEDAYERQLQDMPDFGVFHGRYSFHSRSSKILGSLKK